MKAAHKRQTARMTSIHGRLRAGVQELREQLLAEKRRKKRQAAPFSRDKRKKKPDRPGRGKGKGTFSYLGSPSEDEITDHEDVKAADSVCPDCGGRLEPDGHDDTFVSGPAESKCRTGAAGEHRAGSAFGPNCPTSIILGGRRQLL